MLQIITKIFKTLFDTPADRSLRFVQQFLLPDMVDKGFGFGRAAVGAALVKLRVQSFDDVIMLTKADLEIIGNGRGVGPKVMKGFSAYLAKIGRLPDADEPIASLTVDSVEVTAPSST